jgi:hypothetical protein
MAVHTENVELYLISFLSQGDVDIAYKTLTKMYGRTLCARELSQLDRSHVVACFTRSLFT